MRRSQLLASVERQPSFHLDLSLNLPHWPPPAPRWTDRWHAKYELAHVVRTHMGQDDAHYGCVYQREDEQGNVGESAGAGAGAAGLLGPDSSCAATLPGTSHYCSHLSSPSILWPCHRAPLSKPS